MLRFVRALSPQTEFAIVILGEFGLFILGSVLWMLSTKPYPISDAKLLLLIVYELSILISLFALLHVRGWTLRKVGVHALTPYMALVGVGLCVVAYAGYVILSVAATIVAPGMASAGGNFGISGSDVTMTTIVLVSLINPIFEEVFLCGYIISALSERGDLTTAINVTSEPGCCVICIREHSVRST